MEILEGRIGGRTTAQFHAEVIRELDEQDLALRRVTSVDAEIRPIVKLRFQHHKLAQLLSAGIAPGDCSLQTGYSLSRISILQRDPAFRELMAHYTKSNIAVMTDLQTRMAGFATDVIDELQDRLELQPETLTNKELIEAAKVANDRGGNSPISRSQVQVATLTAADIKAIKEEVRAAEHGQLIEGQYSNIPGGSCASQSTSREPGLPTTEAITYNPGTQVGEPLNGATHEEAPALGALEGCKGEGEDV